MVCAATTISNMHRGTDMYHYVVYVLLECLFNIPSKICKYGKLKF